MGAQGGGRDRAIRHALHQPGQGVRRQGCDDKQVGVVRQCDMADLVALVQLPQVGDGRSSAHCAKGEGLDEFLGGVGHQHLHLCPGLRQFGAQVNRFVGSDAAGNA